MEDDLEERAVGGESETSEKVMWETTSIGSYNNHNNLMWVHRLEFWREFCFKEFTEIQRTNERKKKEK